MLVRFCKAVAGSRMGSRASGAINSFFQALRQKPAPPAVEPENPDLTLRKKIQAHYHKGKATGFLPRQLAIETVSFCNARCIMCPQLTMRRKKGTMSNDVHRMIVDKIAAWGAPISLITHAGLGEPLMDPDLGRKIAYEKEVFKEAQVAVFTNAALLDRQRAESLRKAGLDRLSISLNGFKKETYEAVMKIPYERTMENISNFLASLKNGARPMEVYVSLIPTELHSAEEIDAYRDYWSDRVDGVIIPPWISWGNFFQHGDQREQWPCRYIWEVFQVDWDGTVAMCCEDYDTRFPLGDLKDQSPQEIFNSPRMQQQRQEQVAGNFQWPGMCKNCIETYDVARSFWEGANLRAV
jgi:radical SAM protein with 4Fe4S-binding SPASM domain